MARFPPWCGATGEPRLRKFAAICFIARICIKLDALPLQYANYLCDCSPILIVLTMWRHGDQFRFATAAEATAETATTAADVAVFQAVAETDRNGCGSRAGDGNVGSNGNNQGEFPEMAGAIEKNAET